VQGRCGKVNHGRVLVEARQPAESIADRMIPAQLWAAQSQPLYEAM